MRAAYGEKTRSFFSNNMNPKILIDFAGQKVFDAATVDVNIIIIKKNKNEQQTNSCIIKDDCRSNMTDYIRQNNSVISFPANGQSWVILSDIERRIKEKIERIGKPLRDWDINIYRGILTGCNEAFIITKEKRDELIKKSPESAEIIRPILRGRDIKRYGYEFAEQYIIATFPSRRIEIENYPAVRDHLIKYGKKKLEQSGKHGARKKTCHKWYETQDTINYWDDFSKQKIIFQEMVLEPSFMYDNSGSFFCLDTARIITGQNIDYLISILSSKLFFFAVKYFYGGGGLGENGVRMKHTFFKKFSCPLLDEQNKKTLVTFSETAINKYNSSDFLEIDNQINNFIYSLYDISNEEKAFINTIIL